MADVRTYNAYRAAILTVAAGIAAFTMLGGLDTPQGGPTLPQVGHTVTGQSPVDHFNEDVSIGTSQVQTR